MRVTMQVSSAAGTYTSPTTSAAAGPSQLVVSSAPNRCRPGQIDFTALSSLAPAPAATSAALSPSATPLYLPTKLEPTSLFAAGDDVMRCAATTAAPTALPRRLVSTPLVATSQAQSLKHSYAVFELSSDENSVCPSVCLSVRHTRDP